MFYYIHKDGKCIGIISADSNKVKNDAYDNMVQTTDYHSITQATNTNIAKNKIKLILNCSHDNIKSDGKDSSLITITGTNYDEDQLNIFINDEIIELNKFSNNNFIFRLKSNGMNSFNIKINTEKYYSDNLIIKST
jgi:hypothetical protein